MIIRKNRGNNGYVGFNNIGSLLNFNGVLSSSKLYTIESESNWQRPSSWLKMPEMTEGNQRAALLNFVWPGGSGASGVTSNVNPIGFAMIGCTYVVDWGDGITRVYSSGATASYAYYYENIPDSTQTPEGNRQVLVQVYPENLGNTFRVMDFTRSSYGISGAGSTFTAFSGTVVSLKVCSDTLRGLSLNSSLLIGLNDFEYVGNSGITNGSSLFANLRNLTKVSGTEWTKNVTNFTSMFSSCSSLLDVPLLNTSSGVTFSSMFANCRKLQNIPSFDFSSAKTLSSMFSNCSALETLPPLDFKGAVALNSLFTNCTSLKYIPSLNISSATSTSSMFFNCSALETIPFIDTSNVTSTSNMFFGCYALKELPDLNLSKVTSTNSMFYDCQSIKKYPKSFNLASCTDLTQMFGQNFCLREAPELLNTGLVVTANTIFVSCSNLQKIFPLSLPKATSFTSTFFNSELLQSIIIYEANASFDVSNKRLSPAALNDLFTALGVTGSGKTVTISGNWGSPTCNRSIATAKGWAVSG
jgi:hypothetical protein